jgi:AraC-like DNA-binding protein
MKQFTKSEVWDTKTVAPNHAVAYWVEAICSAFLDMNAAPRSRDGFHGRVARTRVGGIGLMQVKSVAQDVRRDTAHIARCDTDALYLITQLDSPWGVRQGRDYFDLRPGDCVLVDSSQPYSFCCPGQVNNVSIEIPRTWLARWFERPDLIAPQVIARDSRWGSVLNVAVDSIGRHAMQPEERRESNDREISMMLSSILRLAIPEPAPRPTEDTRWERITAILDQRSCEPGLTASDVAQSVGISLATLHRAFALRSQSFSDALRKKRLHTAREMLRNPHLDRVLVAEIGRRCGFVDASHFSKQFAEDVGMGPSRWRTASR